MTGQVKLPGADQLLKLQFKHCAKGEIGFTQAKNIVSAPPEIEERPFKTRRKVIVDGWEREDEEEECKRSASLPTPRDTWRECTRFSRITRACAFKPFHSPRNSMPPRWTWTSGVIGSGAETHCWQNPGPVGVYMSPR